MYIGAIKFKRDRESKWEKGYIIASDSYCSGNNVIVDSKYNAINQHNGKSNVYGYKEDEDSLLSISIKR